MYADSNASDAECSKFSTFAHLVIRFQTYLSQVFSQVSYKGGPTRLENL